jgi:hypothetical protein
MYWPNSSLGHLQALFPEETDTWLTSRKCVLTARQSSVAQFPVNGLPIQFATPHGRKEKKHITKK